MLKIRTMVWKADQTQSITAANDKRVTQVGSFLRTFKVDELLQLWNVLTGDMNLVGPRPDVPADVALYTPQERKILDIKPGLVDLASLFFHDEGKKLQQSDSLPEDYYQRIFPLKKKLMLFYVKNQTFAFDCKILALTTLLFFSQKATHAFFLSLLKSYKAPRSLVQDCIRETMS